MNKLTLVIAAVFLLCTVATLNYVLEDDVETEFEKGDYVEQVEIYYDLDSGEILYHDKGVYDEGWEVLDG